MKHKHLSQRRMILAGETSLASPSPKFPQVQVGPRCGFFFYQTLICPSDAAKADGEPICLIDLWRVSPRGRDRNIAVIPQELQGAVLWTRCVGFKGSKKQQAERKILGPFKGYLLSYYHFSLIQMHIIKFQAGRRRITLAQLYLLKFITFTSKSK